MNEKDAIYGFIMYVSSKYVGGIDNHDLLTAAKEYISMKTGAEFYKEKDNINE